MTNPPTDLELRNACAVVAAWRADKHLRAWDPPAHDKTPDWLQRQAAIAYGQVAQHAKAAADGLQSAGFQSSHSHVLALRTVESQMTNERRWALRWSAALAAALAEVVSDE